MAQELTALYIEYIHDVLVGEVLPFDEAVHAADPKDLGLLNSAAARPFATYDTVDLYPDIHQKAAALFHSLICNHCFHNGNKRTAVIALDLFMAVNNQLFAMSHREIYELAKETARANSEGRSPSSMLDFLAQKISQNSVGMEILVSENFHDGLTPVLSANIRKLVALQRTRVSRILEDQQSGIEKMASRKYVIPWGQDRVPEPL